MNHPRAFSLWTLLAAFLLLPCTASLSLVYEAQSTGDNLMNLETLAFIAILVVALAAVWALVRSNIVVANLIPVPLVQELIRAAVDTALDAAQRQAELTETTVDDELVRLIREEATKVFNVQMAQSENAFLNHVFDAQTRGTTAAAKIVLPQAQADDAKSTG